MMVFIVLMCANVHFLPGQGEKCTVLSVHQSLHRAENKVAEVCRTSADGQCLSKTSIYPSCMRD